MSGKRSQGTFDRFWRMIIEPEIESLGERYAVRCADVDAARKRIQTAYIALNRHFSENYMASPDILLDRHKVASCYSLAIIAAEPLETPRYEMGASGSAGGWGSLAERASIANGILALQVGCAVLMSYTRHSVRQLHHDGMLGELLKLEDGVVFPLVSETVHGSYYFDLANYLVICGIESYFDVPLLGMIYYHLERDTVSELLGREVFEEICAVRSAPMLRDIEKGCEDRKEDGSPIECGLSYKGVP